MKLTAIVAYNENFLIANAAGKIPWHIKNDLSFFKRTTNGHSVIMGRGTWDSLPDNFRPLPNRYNIVISRTASDLMDPVLGTVARSVSEAIQMATRRPNTGQSFVIGGAQVYNYCLEEQLLDTVLASEVKGYSEINQGLFFPDLKRRGWTAEIQEEYPEFTVVKYTPEFQNIDSSLL